MPPLPLITTLARAGALEQAWRLFREGGYDQQNGNAAALAVRGRLLKDDGLRMHGEARRLKFAEAAKSYAAADAIEPQPYLAINIATLRLLSGDAAGGSRIASEVLERLAAPGGISETPYWLAATRAEALLILGERDAASDALRKARHASPGNWEDQASTLRQLGLILDHQRGARIWLDPHRPPRSLHFAGHLGVASHATKLGAEVSKWLKKERIGFAWGALAAGADIQIAEAVVASGAELHVMLPVSLDTFRDQSVRPYGRAWETRFEACIRAAASVREVTGVTGAYEPRATSLAADMAMGAAALHARRLESEAIQLLIIDEGAGSTGQGAATARDAGVWSGVGRRQQLIRWPRDGGVAASGAKQEGRPDRVLRALVSVGFADLDPLDEGGFATMLDSWLADWWAKVRQLSGDAHVQPCGNRQIFAFENPHDALAFIRATGSEPTPAHMPPAICGHYALVHDLGGNLAGPGLPRLDAIARTALPGTIVLSDTLATAFAIRRDPPLLEPMGEMEGTPLYLMA